ncbi:hypothetical protein [Streptomyces sp. NPDC094472]|uniref:hypothetical protein n=1 Tax=unclassified Streptomyces TaxID=2593676 RepID=UPI00331EB115
MVMSPVSFTCPDVVFGPDAFGQLKLRNPAIGGVGVAEWYDHGHLGEQGELFPDVDQVSAEGCGRGLGVEDRGQGACGPQQVVGHGPQSQRGGVRVELPRRQVGQGPGFAVGDDLLDDRVVMVLSFGLERFEGTVGEDGVVAPDDCAESGGNSALPGQSPDCSVVWAAEAA